MTNFAMPRLPDAIWIPKSSLQDIVQPYLFRDNSLTREEAIAIPAAMAPAMDIVSKPKLSVPSMLARIDSVIV
jgi:hypothetical protein